MEFEKLLRLMVEKGSSDLFITAGVAPSMKVHGKILPVTKQSLTPEQCREIVYDVMSDKQRAEFAEKNECNFAISARGIGRFRVSAFYQRNLCGMVLRRIETNIPTIEDLELPEIINQLAMKFSHALAEFSPLLEDAYGQVLRIDHYVAKSEFAQAYQLECPTIKETPGFKFTGLFHPLIKSPIKNSAD